jgi:acetolactate synthase-1/2/3 large subunit
MMWEAKRPIVYAGGGIVAAGASDMLRELVEAIDAPAVCT